MEDQVPSSKQYVSPGEVPQENNYFSNPEGPRFANPAEYEAAMNTQNPAQPPMPDFQEMRRIALEQAIQQVKQQSQVQPQVPVQPPEPVQQSYVQPQPQTKVVYVRRNLTLAEILVIFALSCGLVVGTQALWGFVSDVLPRIEIREK